MEDLKKILVVEDDNLLRNIIINQLTEFFIVIPARDGDEALQQIELQNPDLIILDLSLPKVGGFEVLEKLRSLPNPALAQTPVIIVSNSTDSQNTERAKQYNVLEYYAKIDVSLGTIINRVKQIFEK